MPADTHKDKERIKEWNTRGKAEKQYPQNSASAPRNNMSPATQTHKKKNIWK